MNLPPIQKAILEKKKQSCSGQENTEDEPLSGEQKVTGAEICVLPSVSSHPAEQFQIPQKRRNAVLWLDEQHKV